MEIARRRLTRKLVPLFFLPVAAVFVLFGAVTIQIWRAALIEDAGRSLADHAASLRAALGVRRPLEGSSLSALVETISATETVHGIAVYDAEGRAIARSARLEEEPARVDAIVRRTLETGAAQHLVEPIGGRQELLRAERVEGLPEPIVLVLSHDVAPVELMLKLATGRLAVAGLVLGLIASALALWVARSLGRGLGQIVGAAEQLAAGHVAAPPVTGSRFLEMDRVARAMNHLTRSLAEARARAEAAEAERAELERRIIHAQALAVVGQVASSFAHEIGSPLNTILGWSRVLSGDEAVPAAKRKQLEMITSQCERVTRIVQRMLAVARPTRDRKDRVALPDIAREVTAFLAPDLRARRLALELDLDAEAPRVLAVRDQLFQVVMNLCVNAVQVQPKGGVLRVSVASVSAASAGAAPAARIEVADAGPGVPADRRQKIFEPFYSTKLDGGGTGLGLAVASDVIRELGGTVSVGDAPEGGALFTVIIPAAPA
jgi:signal transduction histidine kinase